MKTTKRFERAVSKLYNAFHNGTLDAYDCKYCAVGNLCDNSDEWESVCCYMLDLSEYKGVKKEIIDETGYSPKELRIIEEVFITLGKNKSAINDLTMSSDFEEREDQFKGLCAVIEYLCELDNIPNIMDYTSLFETENNKPIKELTF